MPTQNTQREDRETESAQERDPRPIASSTMGIHALFLILKEMFSVFTIENDIFHEFVIYGFYFIEVGSLYVHFLESF